MSGIRRLGDLIFRRLTDWPTNYQRTATLDDTCRLFAHQEGKVAGFWFHPSALPAPTITAGDIPALDASKIATGQFDAARIPSLDAAKVTTGTFGVDRIPGLPASKTTSGTFDVARIPSGIPRARLANGLGQQDVTSSVNVTSTSAVLKYTLSSTMGSMLATTGRVLWGYEIQGYTGHENTDPVGGPTVKTLRAYANLKVAGTVKGFGRESVVAGSGINDPNYSGITMYGFGAGIASRTGIIDNPGAGAVTAEIYARIVQEVGSPSVDGELRGATVWWVEI
jgi:hypothetical protein